MTITYLPLIGDGTPGGAGGPLVGIGIIAGAAIARESVAGVAGMGRPGNMKTSILMLMSAFTTDNNAGQRLILEIPSGIQPAPAVLGAIDANDPYDYSLTVPVCSAQVLAAGAAVVFPASTAPGSFDLGSALAATAAIFPTIGVTGFIVPAVGSPYGKVVVDFFANSSTGLTGAADPTTALFQLTIDWGASVAN